MPEICSTYKCHTIKCNSFPQTVLIYLHLAFYNKVNLQSASKPTELSRQLPTDQPQPDLANAYKLVFYCSSSQNVLIGDVA